MFDSESFPELSDLKVVLFHFSDCRFCAEHAHFGHIPGGAEHEDHADTSDHFRSGEDDLCTWVRVLKVVMEIKT